MTFHRISDGTSQSCLNRDLKKSNIFRLFDPLFVLLEMLPSGCVTESSLLVWLCSTGRCSAVAHSFISSIIAGASSFLLSYSLFFY